MKTLTHQNSQSNFNKDKSFKEKLALDNWFRYWEVSPSVWDQVIEKNFKQDLVLIPINWGRHTFVDKNTQEMSFDFGDEKPELDLKRLATILNEKSKKVVFFVPLTPYLFIKNGGVPDELFSQSYDEESLPRLVNYQGRVEKVSTYFSAKTFQSFSRFLISLRAFFKAENINCKVKGLNSGVMNDGEFESSFFDSSKSFLNAFKRYLEINSIAKPSIKDAHDYANLSLKLFKEMVSDCLGNYWDGEVKVSFLGSKYDDILFNCFSDEFDSASAWKNLLSSINTGALLSCELIADHKVSNVFQKALIDVQGTLEVENQLGFSLHREAGGKFEKLVMCDVFAPFESQISHYCLRDYFESKGKHHFLNLKSEEFEFNLNTELDSCRVFIFQGDKIDSVQLTKILRFFKLGGKVLVDMSGLSIELRQKFDLFLLENDIGGQSVELVGPVVYFSHGFGQLICFEGAHFENETQKKKVYFWDNIFKFFGLSFMNMEKESHVVSVTLTRQAQASELNYEQIRRILLYNTHSTPTKVVISQTNNFAFLKYHEPDEARVESSPEGIVVNINAYGSIKLDFGFYNAL